MPRPHRHLPRKRLLPQRPDPGQLRKRAKDLFRRVRSGEKKAVARFRDSHPTWRDDDPSALGLHDAQWVIAREYGFESWTKLLRHVERVAGVQRSVEDLPAEALVALLRERDWRAYHPVESQLLERIESALDAGGGGATAGIPDPTMTAVLAGLEHENPRVRAACARLMDHGGDDACIEPLRRALTDPVPKVRLCALHSLQCQRCKREPLAYDVVPDLIRMAQSDPSEKVRRGALGGMAIQPPDRRLVEALEATLERDPSLADENLFRKMLRHHLHACSLEDLLDRIEASARPAVRQAAAQNLSQRPTSAEAARRLVGPAARETDEIVGRCLVRALRRHAAVGREHEPGRESGSSGTSEPAGGGR